MDDRDIDDPGRPPYYSQDFFTIIKDVQNNTPLNVKWISVKQWYLLLLERGVTHTNGDQDSPPLLIPSRFEESYPHADHTITYKLERVFGLDQEQKSFLFKMVQNLLPTRERLHRVGKAETSSCLFCDDPDTMEHLLTCSHNTEISAPLLACLSNHIQDLTPQKVVTLTYTAPDSWELPATWLIASCIGMIWDDRVAKQRSSLRKCRAELKARNSLLKSTKWKHYRLHNSALLLDEALNLHFV